MIVVERTLACSADPGAALGYLSDFGNTAVWDPAVRQATRGNTGPIAPGATWHQACRLLGISTEMTYTLVEVTPGRLVFHGRNEGATCVDTVTVRPAEPGCEVTYRIELELHGLAKLATPVIKMEFEKLGTAGATALTEALDLLAPGARSAELHFPADTPHPLPPRSQEAQA
ncbi:SRPBCC family protein [Actinoplanes sp. TRM 88003]|uniref:SRPBCC family protein n=1 Tax=Paractinoplanes aksuensis TaxID=2939490 RepID=A0ABT1DV59_9ACTN|nr:SRPBCC family protein [Actinoplanes aksuensis]MCO8274737.1 SRPBCC family protein [Actinoplanes aksuensis]